MTRRQKQYYDEIKEFIENKGYSPSYREIAGIMGVKSVATVQMKIEQLVRDGYLKRTEHSARSLRLAVYCPTCQSPL